MGRLPDGYQTVTERVQKFRAEHPQGAIHTVKREVDGNPEIVEFKAMIFRNHAEIELYAKAGIATAVGTAQTFGVHEVSKGVEKCESVAIGRALANLGYDAVETDAPETEPTPEPKRPSSFGRSAEAVAPEAQIKEEAPQAKQAPQTSRFAKHPAQTESSETIEAPKSGFTRGSRFARKE